MASPDTAVEEKLCQFMKEYGGNQCSLELLLFLGRHPHTRFGHLAITHALNGWRLDIEHALRDLEGKGLVTAYADNGTTYYSLTEDESRRSLVLELVREKGSFEWQPRLRRLFATSVAKQT